MERGGWQRLLKAEVGDEVAVVIVGGGGGGLVVWWVWDCWR